MGGDRNFILRFLMVISFSSGLVSGLRWICGDLCCFIGSNAGKLNALLTGSCSGYYGIN